MPTDNLPKPPVTPQAGQTQATPVLGFRPPTPNLTAGAMRPPAPLPTPPAPQVQSQPQSQPQPQTSQPPQTEPLVQPPAPTAKAAKPKRSFLRFLPLILGGILLLGVVIFAAMRFLGGGNNEGSVTISQNSGGGTKGGEAPAKQVVLTYWGLWEPNEALETAFDEFSAKHPGVIIEYKKHSPEEYRERLQSAIAGGSGPDLFRFHASWVPMLSQELSAAPSNIFSATQFAAQYYPVMNDQLVFDNQVWGVPLMYDGLGLYYNKQALSAAGIEVPSTWSDLKIAAKKLTIIEDNEIKRAGAALGTANNVEHFSDILGLLMLQNGAKLSKPNTTEGEQALKFYTDFVTKDQIWSSLLPSSTIAFARGDAAMMLAPSWRAHEVMAINPDLDFGIAPSPKLAEAELAWASYWAEGVSSASKNKQLAWELLAFLSADETLQDLYAQASGLRNFGEIYPKVDLADSLLNAPYVGAYLQDASVATSWYLNSATHDNGLNDRIISYYEDAVTAVVNGADPAEVMPTVASGSAQVLRQFSAGN